MDNSEGESEEIKYPYVSDSSCLEDEETMNNSQGESEEIDYPYVIDIRNALGIVARPGTFALGGEMENAKMQLSIKGVGKIQFPLSKKQGELLKNKCTAAPFGRGSETIVDKSIRDAWQVDAKDITLDNAFNRVINEKVDEIIPILMGESFSENLQVKSELYKLVYYEKGGHFVAHRDTEKAPGMFATLVIQLPANHKGGALIVRHKGETKVFDFKDGYIDDDSDDLEDESDNSEFEDGNREKIFFTVFFADCEHELREITAGHRLVLIYNLVRKNPNSILLPNDDNIKPIEKKQFMTAMKKSVEEWKSDSKGPQFLALKLDHLYTNTNISIPNLKGKDKNIANALTSCKDIAIYLATLTKNEKRNGYNDDPSPWGDKPDLVSEDEDEGAETLYFLHNWIGVDLKKPDFGKLELHKNEMLIKEEFVFNKYEERCKSEYEYTGNEGCKINYFYKKKALVFWPISHEILLSCDTNFTSVIISCKHLSEVKKMKRALEMLNGILLYIEKRHDRAMSQLKDGNKVANIFEIMFLFDDKISCQANNFLPTLIKCYTSDDYSWYGSKKIVGLPNNESAVALAKLIKQLNWDSIRNSVVQLMKECAVSHAASCTQLVSSLLLFGLQEQAINVVEVAALTIEQKSKDLRSNDVAVWAVLLISHDIFSTYFDDFVKQISMMRDYILIQIIPQIYKSLNPKGINQDKIKKCFQTLLSILRDNGWKNLSLESVTNLWPVFMNLNKLNSDASLLNSFVKAVIEHKDSCIFLKALLNIPSAEDAKDNESVQLMVQKRLEQLKVPYPVFSWAQPKANVEMSFRYYGGPELEEIENFLRSEEESKVFGDVFRGKTDAKQFGQEYFKNGQYNK
ncbi:unnamed protein product, partial [Meganyctiphanes norvegica]